MMAARGSPLAQAIPAMKTLFTPSRILTAGLLASVLATLAGAAPPPGRSHGRQRLWRSLDSRSQHLHRNGARGERTATPPRVIADVLHVPGGEWGHRGRVRPQGPRQALLRLPVLAPGPDRGGSQEHR